MTWEFQATVSDVIHRVVSGDGEIAWGIEHHGFDEDEPRALGLAEVALPTGRATLLLIPPLQGGLILDVVRSYQGLTEGELCTLFLGIIDRLRSCRDPESRLSLDAVGLDANGRPSLIPGVRVRLETRPRTALGEMLYHAACGRPWTECLLPVNLALADSSAALRQLVGELLDETHPDSGLDAAFDEAAEALGRLSPPSALPLIPAERDLDPEHALTARLRAASGHRRGRTAQPPALVAVPVEGSAASSSPSPAARLRAASRQAEGRRAESRQAGNKTLSRQGQNDQRLRRRDAPARSRHRRRGNGCARLRRGVRDSLSRLGRFLPRTRQAKSPAAQSGPGLKRVGVIAAVCLTLIGAVLVAHTWAAEPNEPSPSAQTETLTADAPTAAQAPSEGEIVQLLDELSEKRAEALSAGDRTALEALTVPDSAAAAADEIIDIDRFVDSDYAIDLAGIDIIEVTDESIVAAARMSASAERAGEMTRFPPQRVEFTLARATGGWKIETVRNLDDE